MKTLLRITLILVLTATTGLVGNVPEAKGDRNTSAETETATTAATPIPVSLPAVATVTLSDRNTRSGQVVDLNSEQLIIKINNNPATVSIADIVKVEFDGEVWWPTGSDKIKIRGDDTIKEGEPVRLEVQMDGFEWVEKEQGIANISSEAVMDIDGEGREYLDGILDVIDGGKFRYVVREIEFDLENQLLIMTATAASRQE